MFSHKTVRFDELFEQENAKIRSLNAPLSPGNARILFNMARPPSAVMA